MSINFKKLDIDLDYFLKNMSRKEKTFEWGNFLEYKTNLELDDVNFVLKQRYSNNIFPKKVNLTKIAAPGVGIHRDNWNAAINVYLKADNSITRFYQIKNKENFQDKYTFEKNEVQETESIKASTGDVYLINTNMPHSVEIPYGKEDRIILRIIWDIKFTFFDILQDLM